MDWFKFYGKDYLSDPKFIGMSALQRSCWLTLLALGSQDNGRVRWITEEILIRTSGGRLDVKEVTEGMSIIKLFEELEMITVSNGEILIKNWGKRQEAFLTNAERQARFRDRNKRNGIVTPVLQQSNAREDKSREDKKRKEDTYARFARFWEVYPRKVGKQDAVRAWTKINPDESLTERIIEAVRRWCQTKDWTKEDGQYIPHASRFLNARRWEDEIKAPVSRSLDLT